MFTIEYNPNENTISLYYGIVNNRVLINTYQDASYSITDSGTSYTISTVNGSTLTTQKIVPFVSTMVSFSYTASL